MQVSWTVPADICFAGDKAAVHGHMITGTQCSSYVHYHLHIFTNSPAFPPPQKNMQMSCIKTLYHLLLKKNYLISIFTQYTAMKKKIGEY